MKYPTLNNLIDTRGVKRTVIAANLGITAQSLRRKINGVYPFTWNETCLLQEKFFPDTPKDVLFSEDNSKFVS